MGQLRQIKQQPDRTRTGRLGREAERGLRPHTGIGAPLAGDSVLTAFPRDFGPFLTFERPAVLDAALRQGAPCPAGTGCRGSCPGDPVRPSGGRPLASLALHPPSEEKEGVKQLCDQTPAGRRGRGARMLDDMTNNSVIMRGAATEDEKRDEKKKR